MYQSQQTQKKNGMRKRLLLLATLAAAMVALSSCYMEPDRIVNNNGTPVGTGGAQFDTVITPTPELTPTPTPAPTNNQQIDWGAWDFGNDNATNPPSNVNPGATQPIITPTPNPNQGGISVTTPTPKPTTGTSSSGGDSSASSDTLKSGSSGTKVKELQQRLKELEYYSGSVDGKFGAGTTEAVKAFQKNNNLTADGVAGKATQEKLYSYYAVKNTGGSSSGGSSSSGNSGSSTGSNSSQYTNGKTDIYLQIGSSGSQVKILQNRLIVLGYLSGTADGEFAETTAAAVEAFQKRNSIYADGIAGPTTLSKLYSSSAKKASAVAATIGSLKKGMTGGSVKALQQRLKDLGYYNGNADGDFGDGTEQAVIAFQAAYGLKTDGVAGKATQNAIYGGSGGGGGGGGGGGSSSSPENYGKGASTNGYSTLSASGGNRTNIEALQSVLSSKNYYTGTPDGKYGGGTEAAVRAYQESAGLRVTGMAGPTTQRLLFGGMGESGSYSKLEQGSSGSKVKDLQYTLYELKYYDGQISGSYDEATSNAVMLFQEVNGLYVDGIAGQDTQRRLYSSNARPNNQ